MTNDSNSWSRRRFSKAVFSTQILIASGALTIPFGCADEPRKQVGLLSEDQFNVLRLAMDEIIPANEKMPSASSIGGVSYILNILDEFPELAPVFNQIIDQIESSSRLKDNSGFSNLTKEDRIEVLLQLEETNTALFKTLKDFTYESYYTNEKIFGLIKYEPHPTGTLGPKMDPFDESLLRRMMNNPPSYIKI